MEKMQTNIIEKVKDVILVVLVFTTILLLYFLWGNRSFENFKFSEAEVENPVDIESVILPEQVVYGFGTDDYAVAEKNKAFIWKELIIKTFKEFSNESNILVEEITASKYKEVMSYPSVCAKFNYDIPFSGFCEEYEIKAVQGYEGIACLTEIGFSDGSTESMFIYDGSRNKYYRLVGNTDLKLFEKIKGKVENIDFTAYYTLKTFLGEESSNETLIPIELPEHIVPIYYEIDTEYQDEYAVSKLAETFFGENFDFVRKIEESSGTTIFMYGYGQKVLIINPNEGSVEYKQDAKTNGLQSKNMLAALETALNFIGSHGGLKNAQGYEAEVWLEDISYIDDKRTGYRFEFSQSVDGSQIYCQENKAIIVEVVNDQVCYYRRELINLNLNEAVQNSQRHNTEVLSAINMLAANYDYMRDTLAEKGALDKIQREITFELLANEIESFEIGYLKPEAFLNENGTAAARGGELIPVWVVKIMDYVFYFDLYSGKPQGISVLY